MVAPQELTAEYMIQQLIAVHEAVRDTIENNPEAFTVIQNREKRLAAVDLMAEHQLIRNLNRDFTNQVDGRKRRSVYVVGEETLSEGTDLAGRRETCVILDAVDGTDLLQRGFSNWCSAAVVFDAIERSILGAYIATANDGIYYAERGVEGVRKVEWEEGPEGLKVFHASLSGPNAGRRLEQASVCAYAQKADRLIMYADLLKKDVLLRGWVKGLASKKTPEGKRDDPGFRFYNLAGNPMMARVCAGAVDAVFDLAGQCPHDVVPGAFVAVKGGAFLGSADEDRQITLTELGESLLRPGARKSRVRYILAADRDLYREILAMVLASG